MAAAPLHSASYDSYADLLQAVSQRVKDELTVKRSAPTQSKPRPVKNENPKKVIPGGRAILGNDSDEENDEDEEVFDVDAADMLGWETVVRLFWSFSRSLSADLHSQDSIEPTETVLKFRNLSPSLIPTPTPAFPVPLSLPTSASSAPSDITQTLEQDFQTALDKSTLLVNLQQRYISRRIAAGNTGDSSPGAAIQDALAALMDILKGRGTGGSTSDDEPATNALQEIDGTMGDVEATAALLLGQVYTQNVQHPSVDMREIAIVSDRSRDFGRFLPTRAPVLSGLEFETEE